MRAKNSSKIERLNLDLKTIDKLLTKKNKKTKIDLGEYGFIWS